MTTTSSLPHWDMTVLYPSLQSPEFAQDFVQVVQNILDLSQHFTTNQIMHQPHLVVDDTVVQTFETLVAQYNTCLERVRTLNAYIACFVSTDSQNDLAQAKMSELQQPLVLLSFLSTCFTAWIGSMDVDTLIERSTVAHKHAYALRRAKQQSTHLMTSAEEALSTEMSVISGIAWEKLQNNITSQLTVILQGDEQTQKLPMSVIRNMAYDADREVRRRAYEAELAGWKDNALPLAASLNSIKGEVNVLTQHRQWKTPLDNSLFFNSIDRQTLDAMLSAARSAFPDFRRYLHAKARALGLSQLAWYDLFAPLHAHGKLWKFDEAAQFITEQFGTYSSRLSDFAARAFREHWIDAEPRPGKRDGAFCIPLRTEESRVFSNYKPGFAGVSTLAHELGHGYHNLNLAHRTPLQRSHPMTLAETASIFCETIIRQAALHNVDTHEQIAILEASLQGSCQLIVDITSRFLFEQQVFERRKQRELSIDELNNLMVQAQRQTYGDGLDDSALHPYMWAVKQHYYSASCSFYNYPYMFGLLFGLGLYAHYQRDPETFKQGYDDLLSSTGMEDAATLATRFDIDLHAEAFWRSSLDVIRADIDRFEQLLKT